MKFLISIEIYISFYNVQLLLLAIYNSSNLSIIWKIKNKFDVIYTSIVSIINTKQNNNSNTKYRNRYKEFIENTKFKIDSISSLLTSTITAKQSIDQYLNYILKKSINSRLNSIDILSQFWLKFNQKIVQLLI